MKIRKINNYKLKNFLLHFCVICVSFLVFYGSIALNLPLPARIIINFAAGVIAARGFINLVEILKS